MAEKEIVRRGIPLASVVIPRLAVPPVAVEAAVGEAREFSQDVEDAFPDDVPAEKLFEQQREEHIRNNPGELGPSLIHGHPRLFHAHGLENRRVDVRLGDDHHHAYHTEGGCGFFGHIPPVDAILTGVFKLVDHCWKTGPHREVFEVEVRRVIVARHGTLSTQLLLKRCELIGDDIGEGSHFVLR